MYQVSISGVSKNIFIFLRPTSQTVLYNMINPSSYRIIDSCLFNDDEPDEPNYSITTVQAMLIETAIILLRVASSYHPSHSSKRSLRLKNQHR